MRRRERFQGMVWLAGWRGIEGSANVASDAPGARYTLEASLRRLCQLGYVVEMEVSAAQYLVRCLAHNATEQSTLLAAGMSYSGSSLGDVLSAAAWEADSLFAQPREAIMSNKERVRWVHS